MSHQKKHKVKILYHSYSSKLEYRTSRSAYGKGRCNMSKKVIIVVVAILLVLLLISYGNIYEVLPMPGDNDGCIFS